MDHDFYWQFPQLWWLIFPLFWMVFALTRVWSRHTRANRALDIIKTYADQGKDPPPELIRSLQGGMDGGCGLYGGRYSPQRQLYRGFLFLALAIGFGFMMFWNFDDSGHWHHNFGLMLPTVIFAAFAFTNFLSLLFMPRGGWPTNSSWPPNDRDGR